MKKFSIIISLILMTACAPLSTTNNEQIIHLPDGSNYIGALENNLPHGIGTINYPDGTTYIGEFNYGSPEGDGKLITKEREYQGKMVDGKPNGYGISKNSDGTLYEGEHIDGIFSGKGKLTLSDGTFFIGYFKNNRPHRGTIVLTDGRELPLSQ